MQVGLIFENLDVHFLVVNAEEDFADTLAIANLGKVGRVIAESQSFLIDGNGIGADAWDNRPFLPVFWFGAQIGGRGIIMGGSGGGLRRGVVG